jgi:pyrimidine-nucleoside phosphorylase
MRTLPDAQALAEAMLALGTRAGREVVCLLTDMDQPLGRAVGNALEIREAVETLRGEGPPDFTELVVEATARLLALSDLGVDEDEGRRRAESALADGSATAAYERWIRAQGGSPELDALPSAPVVREVPAARDGFVEALGAIAVGEAALRLGAGRATKEDVIDHAVGVRCLRKRGDAVRTGEALAEIHARDDAAADAAVGEVAAAYTVGGEAPSPRSVVLDVVRA